MPSNVVEQDVGGGGGGDVVVGWVCGVGFGLLLVARGFGVLGRDVRGRVLVGVGVALVVADVVVGAVVVLVLGGAIDGPWNVAAEIAWSPVPAPRLLTSQNIVPSMATAMTPMAIGFVRDGVVARCRPAMPSVILCGEFECWNVCSCAPSPQERA